MAVMVTAGGLTRADLDALPDDGRRHELIDGAIVMTPAPGTGHQRIVMALGRLLWDALDGTVLEVLAAPFDVVLAGNVVEPDLLVAQSAALTERDLPAAPRLVVEVRSPSSRWIDDGRKREIYQEAGVPSYWLIDPAAPAITVLESVDGVYEEAATATGDQTIDVKRPVPLSINPAALLRR